MIKKFIFILLPMMLILASCNGDNDGELASPPITKDEEPTEIADGDEIAEENNIDYIYTLAKQGMIMNVSAAAGQATYEEVTEILGTPERIDETVAGDYAVYPEITIGFKDSIAYDFRSYEEDLQHIYYMDILERLGEPDDIKYYQDEQFDQIILIYDVHENYQLK